MLDLLKTIDKAHIAFSDMFPHPGLVSVGGTQIFVRRQWIEHLVDLVQAVKAKIDEIPQDSVLFEIKETLNLSWYEAGRLVNQLEKEVDLTRRDICDQIARHLYFISGFSWWLICRTQGKNVVVFRPISIIEPIVGILSQTGHSTTVLESPKAAIKEISEWRKSLAKRNA